MSDERQRSLWDIRTWPRWAKLVAVVAGLAGAGAAAWYSRDAVLARSKGVQDTLLGIAIANEQYKQCCVIDQDEDGRGEYGWLGELSGVDPCRIHGQLMNVSPFVEPALGKKDTSGRSSFQGYRYQLALPVAGARWKFESKKLARTGVAADANRQEAHWLGYAWPEDENLAARRAYFVDERGEIWFTDCAVTPYRGANGPRVSAAFVKGGQGRPGAGQAPSYTGTDGNTWTLLER